MKANELIEKILNKEIKSGTLIKVRFNSKTGLSFDKILKFNGNWFGDTWNNERDNDIILFLCSNNYTFEIMEEGYIEKLDYNCTNYKETIIQNKINEIIDRLNNEKQNHKTTK